MSVECTWSRKRLAQAVQRSACASLLRYQAQNQAVRLLAKHSLLCCVVLSYFVVLF
jgi:hypothetical protein